MLNPLALPAEVIAALRSVAAIERLVDERLSRLDDRLKGLDIRIERLPDRLEERLRGHFEGQREDLAELHDELVANRKHAEKLPGEVRGVGDRVEGLRDEIGGVREEVGSVRDGVGGVGDEVGGVRDEVRALRDEMRALLGEVSEVRETVEPLQGPAERVARISKRLPGNG